MTLHPSRRTRPGSFVRRARAAATKRDGRCQCGKVSYRCPAEPPFRFDCRCTDCRESTGAACAPPMFFAREGVEITGAALPRIDRRQRKPARRGFCPSCGTQVAGADDAPSGKRAPAIPRRFP
ncbi:MULTISPECIES: GFA family protein [unclassified Rhodanobacter]|uniref:GFA family protein n=1 Tax=Rhodanobacter humi TaxID=1888173 RepID=A0ABV4AQI6_9GAMM